MIRLLALLLVLQAAVVAVLYWPAAPQSGEAASLVTNLAVADVERIEVTDAEGTSNTLTRDTSGWVLASGLPADEVKVATLLAGLLTSDPGYAVATSEGAARRFKVAEESFERRIVIHGAGLKQTVYLGSSPSFRKIHARRDGEKAIYTMELNSYDAPADDASWLDRSLLAVEDITAVELYGLKFRLGSDGWSRDDGENIDPASMEQLVQALANLRVSGLASADDEATAEAGEALRLAVTNADGELRLTVLDNPDSERYYLRGEAYEAIFNTSAFDAERLIDAARAAAGMEDDERIEKSAEEEGES